MCTHFHAPKRSKLAIALFAAGSSGFIGTAAIAQEQIQNANAPRAVDEEVVVTGTRVRQTTGMAEPTPVTVMSVTELNELNPGSTLAEQLDELPQFFATPTAQRGGNAVSTTAGGSYLNLRGMGLNRTLVLLDGTRVAPADANGSVNVDNFPAALMERVDIVTGGASAAYGADAVAGVAREHHAQSLERCGQPIGDLVHAVDVARVRVDLHPATELDQRLGLARLRCRQRRIQSRL